MEKCIIMNLKNTETGATISAIFDRNEVGREWKIGDIVRIDSNAISFDPAGKCESGGASGVHGKYKILSALPLELVNLDAEEIDVD